MKTKSALQIPRTLTRNAILLVVAALVLWVSPTPALAADCVAVTAWTGTTGSWFVAGNWLNQQPPTVTIGAQINNGGTAQINTSTPTASACDLTIGFDATDSGNVFASTGTLSVGHEAEIGAHGKGTLTVTNGGTANVGFLTIAALGGASSSGTVSVDASSLTCTTAQGIWVGGDPGGAGGIGLLSVTNGGTVSAGNGNGIIYVFSSGTVSGNGTVITTTAGMTFDGTLKPNGQLTISGSGGLTLNSSAATLLNVVPSGADNVNISAVARLGGRLSIAMTGTFTAGTTYTLLHAGGGRNGMFGSQSISYPTNQCFTPVITYDANNVYLYLQPNCW